MIDRFQIPRLQAALDDVPVVLLLGPPEIGKTALARAIADGRDPAYFDLSTMPGRAAVSSAGQGGRMAIVEDVHRMPDVVPVIAETAGQGGQFILTATQIPDGIGALAGQVFVAELSGFSALDVGPEHWDLLFERGGYPASFQAQSDAVSLIWRQKYLQSVLDTQVPDIGAKGSSERVRALLRAIADGQGMPLNVSAIARDLDVSDKTIVHDLDALEDLMLIRVMDPMQIDIGKRLVKRPKVFLRDSGLSGSLGVLSWDGFVIDQVASVLPVGIELAFYKTSAGAEAPLVFDLGADRFAILPSETGRVTRGFAAACDDVGATRSVVVSANGAGVTIGAVLEILREYD